MKLFFICLLFNSFLPEGREIKVLSGVRQLFFHSEQEDGIYYHVKSDSPLRISISGPRKVEFFVRINIPAGTRSIMNSTLTVQMDGLKMQKFLLPSGELSNGVYRDEITFFPSKLFKINIDIPKGDHTLTFSVPRSSPAGVALRWEEGGIREKEQEVKKISLDPYILTGVVSDSYGIKGGFISGAGAGMRYFLPPPFFLNAMFNFAFYPERYYFITQDNVIRFQSGVEHKLKIVSRAGLTLFNSESIKVSPVVGISIEAFIFGDASNLVLGPTGGLEINAEAFKGVKLKVMTAFTYDVLKESSSKPVGGFPFGFIDYSFNIGVKWLSFGYIGEYLLYPEFRRIDDSGSVTKYKKNVRFYNLFALGINL